MFGNIILNHGLQTIKYGVKGIAPFLKRH